MTVIYSSESAAPRSTSRPGAIMPLLVILFIVSYGILTMLVFEQGQTIESQRGLIKEMLKDSTQLAAMKDKIARDNARDDEKRVHEKTPAGSFDQKTSDQKSADSTNPAAAAKGSNKDAKPLVPGKSAHTMKQVPGKPPADLEDVRRSTKVI